MADTNAHINYTVSDIDRYLKGQMTAQERHNMERASLQDPFLADAIEGYREADKKQTEKHLADIALAIQGNKQQTKIISIAKKKSYSWQIAASVIAVIGVSVFFFTQSHQESLAPLASNEQKTEAKERAVTSDSSGFSTPLSKDSLLTAIPQTAQLSDRKKTIADKPKAIEKNATEPALSNASAPVKEDNTTMIASAPAASRESDDKAAKLYQQQPLPTADTLSSLSEVIVTRSAKRAAKPAANMWTTDKDKPFILSEVEVINVGNKKKKLTDTLSVKPEGGWQSFQEYLFSKLSKKDTIAFMDAGRFDGDLELEFSFTQEGSPYNIKVFHAQDSTMANEVISAIQQGPKWISSDKKEKRLHVKY